MKRKWIWLPMLLALACIVLTSCNKRCRCIKYDSTSDYYTPEELSQRGKNCAQMISLEGLAAQYYSLCEWTY